MSAAPPGSRCFRFRRGVSDSSSEDTGIFIHFKIFFSLFFLEERERGCVTAPCLLGLLPVAAQVEVFLSLSVFFFIILNPRPESVHDIRSCEYDGLSLLATFSRTSVLEDFTESHASSQYRVHSRYHRTDDIMSYEIRHHFMTQQFYNHLTI